MDILRFYDNELESHGLDEAYLDLTDFCLRNYISTEKDILDLGREIKMKIYNETKLTASIGFACNKMLAKICSDINKPNGDYFLKNDIDFIETFMKHLNIRKIPCIGQKTEIKLNLLGIFKCNDIIDRFVDLYYLFPSNVFEFYYSSAIGIGGIYHSVSKEAKTVSSSDTFKSTKNMNEIEDFFKAVVSNLIKSITEMNCKGKTITVEIRDKNERTESKCYSAVNYIGNDQILNHGLRLLRTLCENKTIRLIRVKMSNLVFVDQVNYKEEGKIEDFFKNMKTDNNSKKLSIIEENTKSTDNLKNLSFVEKPIVNLLGKRSKSSVESKKSKNVKFIATLDNFLEDKSKILEEKSKKISQIFENNNEIKISPNKFMNPRSPRNSTRKRKSKKSYKNVKFHCIEEFYIKKDSINK